MTEFKLTDSHLKQNLEQIARNDAHLKQALSQVGYPQERRNNKGFAVFMSIIISQQLSTKAASTIRGRVIDVVGENFDPHSFLSISDEKLRACGLSYQKIRYGRNLCEQVVSDQFVPDQLEGMSDDEAIATITNLLGFGRWSAEMYLLFSLGRPDIWPAGDLAIQEGVRRLKNLPERPKFKEMDGLAEGWRPYRSAMAIFLWHYYSTTPAID